MLLLCDILLPAMLLGSFSGTQPNRITQAQLAEDLRLVEAARWRFDLSGESFDHVHPAATFTDLAALYTRKTCLLRLRYGQEVTDLEVETERLRIEAHSMAPDIWDSMKAALGGNVELIREVICRPIVVDRRLRQLVAQDRTIQAYSASIIRQKRRDLRAGKRPVGLGAFSADCTADDDCAPIPQPIATRTRMAFSSGASTTPVLEDDSAFYVAKILRWQPKLTIEGYVVSKADYSSWVRSAICDGAL